MDKEPHLLVWNYTGEEKAELDGILQELAAPPAVTIEKDQGHLLLKEIIHTDKRSEEELHHDEKVLLFYNIPQKGILFLMDAFKKRELPRPIYAVVTEHSINWPFSKLLEHLIEEREEMRKRQADSQNA
jgi:hypothetical protein